MQIACVDKVFLLLQTLFEIVTSEASYLRSLHLLISHFVESVEFDTMHSPAAILTKREYKILFSNIIPVWTVSARSVCLCVFVSCSVTSECSPVFIKYLKGTQFDHFVS